MYLRGWKIAQLVKCVPWSMGTCLIVNLHLKKFQAWWHIALTLARGGGGVEPGSSQGLIGQPNFFSGSKLLTVPVSKEDRACHPLASTHRINTYTFLFIPVDTTWKHRKHLKAQQFSERDWFPSRFSEEICHQPLNTWNDIWHYYPLGPGV